MTSGAPGTGEGQGEGGGQGGGGQGGAGGGGGSSAKWYDAYPDPIRTSPHITKHAAPEAALTELVNLVPLVGRKGAPIPEKNAKPEEWDAFFEAAGRPKTAAEYDFKETPVPKGLGWNENFEKEAIASFHARRLTQDQAAGVRADYIKIQEKMQAAVLESHSKATEKLKGKYGEAYGKKVEEANEAFEFLFGEKVDPTSKMLLQEGIHLGSHPTVFEAMLKVAPLLREQKLIGGKQSGGAGHMTVATAQAEISNIEGSEESRKILYDAHHPEHDALVNRRAALYDFIEADRKRSAGEGEG